MLKWIFLCAICLKILIYLIILIKIQRNVGLKKIRNLISNYLKLEHFLSSAWRLGTFFALMLSYAYFYFYFKDKNSPSVLSLWQDENYLVFAIVSLILVVILRSVLQSITDWLDCNLTIKRLKRIATTKKILGGISQATNVLMWTQPLVAMKWSVVSRWTVKMIAAGKFIKFSEKWVDKKIQKKVGQYVATMILATLIETFIKISLIVGLHFVLQT